MNLEIANCTSEFGLFCGVLDLTPTKINLGVHSWKVKEKTKKIGSKIFFPNFALTI